MYDVFLGFLRLRLLAAIPLLLVILVLLGASAFTRGSAALGIAFLAGVAVLVVVAFRSLSGSRRAPRARRRPGSPPGPE